MLPCSGAESCGGVGCCAWPDHKYKLRHNLDTKQTVKSGRQRGASASASASASNTKNNKNGVSWPLAQARDRSKQRLRWHLQRLRHIVCKWELLPPPPSAFLRPTLLLSASSCCLLPLPLPAAVCRLLFLSGRLAWCLLFITHTRSINGKCSRSRRSRHCWTNPSKAVPASPHLTWAPPIRSPPLQTDLHSIVYLRLLLCVCLCARVCMCLCECQLRIPL